MITSTGLWVKLGGLWGKLGREEIFLRGTDVKAGGAGDGLDDSVVGLAVSCGSSRNSPFAYNLCGRNGLGLIRLRQAREKFVEGSDHGFAKFEIGPRLGLRNFAVARYRMPCCDIIAAQEKIAKFLAEKV